MRAAFAREMNLAAPRLYGSIAPKLGILGIGADSR